MKAVISTALWRNANYRRIVFAVGLGAVSSGAANIGLDLVAVVVLDASALQVGILNAVGTVSYLVLSIPVGVLVDRLRKSVMMGCADLLAGVALLWIPIAYLTGMLNFWHLLVVSFLAGFAGMVFGIASKSVLPQAVPESDLGTAYARQESITTSIEIAAPLLVGQALRVVAAPFVLVISAFARGVSAIFSFRIAESSKPQEAADGGSFWRALGEGLRFSLSNPPLRLIVLSTAVMNFGLAVGSAIEMVYYVRVLAMTAPEIGFVLSGIGVGGLLGTLIAPRLLARFGDVWSFRASTLAVIPLVAVLPLLANVRDNVFLLVALQGMFYSIAVVIYNVNSYTLAAKLTPKSLLGRQMSFMGFAGMGVVPIASIVGGLAGDALGYVPTLWIWVGISVLAAVPVLLAAPLIRAAGR